MLGAPVLDPIRMMIQSALSMLNQQIWNLYYPHIQRPRKTLDAQHDRVQAVLAETLERPWRDTSRSRERIVRPNMCQFGEGRKPV